MKIKKTLFAISVAATTLFSSGAVIADPSADATVAEQLDELFYNLSESSFEDAAEIEGEITTLWHDSGSPAMNFLLSRGISAITNGDLPKALEHLSALIDHAPDFAEAWNARATVYFMMDEYGLSAADIQQALIHNPRHFGALSGLGLIYEVLDNPDAALRAYLAAQAVHPHLEAVNEAILRLQTSTGGIAL